MTVHATRVCFYPFPPSIMKVRKFKQIGRALLPEIPEPRRTYVVKRDRESLARYLWRAYRFTQQRSKQRMPGPAFDAFVIVACLLLGLASLFV